MRHCCSGDERGTYSVASARCCYILMSYQWCSHHLLQLTAAWSEEGKYHREGEGWGVSFDSWPGWPLWDGSCSLSNVPEINIVNWSTCRYCRYLRSVRWFVKSLVLLQSVYDHKYGKFYRHSSPHTGYEIHIQSIERREKIDGDECHPTFLLFRLIFLKWIIYDLWILLLRIRLCSSESADFKFIQVFLSRNAVLPLRPTSFRCLSRSLNPAKLDTLDYSRK